MKKIDIIMIVIRLKVIKTILAQLHKQEKKKIDFDKNKLELLKKSKRYNIININLLKG